MIGTKYGNFVQDLPYIIPTSNNSLCLLVSEENGFFSISANEKKRIALRTMLFFGQSG
jgi:hypothetical protein